MSPCIPYGENGVAVACARDRREGSGYRHRGARARAALIIMRNAGRRGAPLYTCADHAARARIYLLPPGKSQQAKYNAHIGLQCPPRAKVKTLPRPPLHACAYSTASLTASAVRAGLVSGACTPHKVESVALPLNEVTRRQPRVQPRSASAHSGHGTSRNSPCSRSPRPSSAGKQAAHCPFSQRGHQFQSASSSTSASSPPASVHHPPSPQPERRLRRRPSPAHPEWG